jgi:hypothetical protein
MNAKYAPIYVAEFQIRYNNRENADIVGTAIIGWLMPYRTPAAPSPPNRQQRGNREAKKPKKEKPKVAATAPCAVRPEPYRRAPV